MVKQQKEQDTLVGTIENMQEVLRTSARVTQEQVKLIQQTLASA